MDFQVFQITSPKACDEPFYVEYWPRSELQIVMIAFMWLWIFVKSHLLAVVVKGYTTATETFFRGVNCCFGGVWYLRKEKRQSFWLFLA